MRRRPSKPEAAARAALPFALALLAGCRDEAVPPAPLRPVLTMTAATVTAESFGPFASTVEARYQTQLGFQLAGRMIARDVFVGDTVRAGQRLAAVDPAVTQFALLRARADVVDAQAQLANAEGIEARQRALASGGNATQATLDNAVAGRDTARARLDQARASLRMAETQIGYTELHANFDGVVTAWNAEVGQYVDSGQAVVTLARPDLREAVVDIPDELIGRIAPGMGFTVRLQAADGVAARGTVREIGPVADEATRTHRVRLTLADAPPAFRLGTTVTIAQERRVAPYVPVPAEAVRTDDGGAFVWLLAPDGRTVTRRRVTLAPPSGDGDAPSQLHVATGLADGDRVVTVGVHSLTDGQAVAGTAGQSAFKLGGTKL